MSHTYHTNVVVHICGSTDKTVTLCGLPVPEARVAQKVARKLPLNQINNAPYLCQVCAHAQRELKNITTTKVVVGEGG